MPDVEGHYQNHGQFWIELKSGARPKNGGIVRLPTRPKQCDWLLKRWRCGGKAWMLIQIGHGHDRAIYLIAGDRAHAVHAGVPESYMIANCAWKSDRDCPSPQSAMLLRACRSRADRAARPDRASGL